MDLDTAVTDRILGAVQSTQECDLDMLTKHLTDLSWNQAFLEVDRLSRQGKVRVTLDTGSRHIIRLPHHDRVSATREV